MMNAGPQYALRAKFEVDNMQVLEGDNLVTANTFYVRDDHKSVELYTHIREEKEDWLESLFQTIKQLYQKKSSLRVGREMLRPSETEIGKKQPYLQKMENVLKCMECTVQFSILKHKHHCKSCGAVVCAKCSDFKHPLAWEDNRKSRVCKSCNNILKCSDQEALTPPPPQDYLPVRPKGLLEVSASTPGVHSGWLTLRPPRGTAAKAAKRFFLLLPDFVLYSFRTEADSSALTATPLPGFTVLMGHDIRGDGNVPEKEKEKIIKLAHSSSKKLYYFAGTSAEEVDRWGEMLRMAARAEIPPECSHLVSDTQSTSSTEYENM